MSFLQRLKQKNVIPSTPTDEKQGKIDDQKKAAVAVTEAQGPVDQLKVDIYRTHTSIIIYAQIAGAKVDDCNVSIEGDNDIVTIKGERGRPNGEMFQGISDAEKEELFKECSWGKFYRQIILPVEVDSTRAEAKMKDGVMVLVCPLKASVEPGIRIKVTEV
jgi:HSP20 family protein